jgi:hypothetical protein
MLQASWLHHKMGCLLQQKLVKRKQSSNKLLILASGCSLNCPQFLEGAYVRQLLPTGYTPVSLDDEGNHKVGDWEFL